MYRPARDCSMCKSLHNVVPRQFITVIVVEYLYVGTDSETIYQQIQKNIVFLSGTLVFSHILIRVGAKRLMICQNFKNTNRMYVRTVGAFDLI